MVLESLFDVQSLYILKDGVPIFHWNYEGRCGVSQTVNKKIDKKENEKDSALVSGFLSAIVCFANETGIGKPKSYLTENKKFSFLTENNFLFVVELDKTISDEKSFEFLTIIAKTFHKVYHDRPNISEVGAPFLDFTGYLLEIITKFNAKEILNTEINENELLEKVQNQDMFKNLIPKCYIDFDKNKTLSTSRRALFKLIDGNNSILSIAEKINDTPTNVFYTLQSYEKFGYIRIDKISNKSEK